MRYRIQEQGNCQVNSPHPEHLYPLGIVHQDAVSMGWCLGQYAHCRNCDDRGCMDCVLRNWHDKCEWSCPMCNEGDADYLKNIDPLDEDVEI